MTEIEMIDMIDKIDWLEQQIRYLRQTIYERDEEILRLNNLTWWERLLND